MKKADPNLRFEGMQFLVMQSAVKLVEPSVAYAFYENSRHSRQCLMDATLQREMPGHAPTYSGHGN